ncbi:MAG: dTMP kinase [Nitrososphaeraceae archaeon]
MSQGHIIVIEGIDKAGKGTQCSLLKEYFVNQNRETIVLDFPDYSTYIGKEIRAFLDGRRNFPFDVQHMLLAANRLEKKEQINELLERGYIIIMDRYYQSNLIYGFSRGLDLKWLENLDITLPKEDIVIVIDIPPETSYARIQINRDIFETDRIFLNQVYSNYKKFASEKNWSIVKGDINKNKVHENIIRILKNSNLI